MKSQEEQWLLAEKYNGVKSDAFFADCKALALGTPLGYLIGQVPFLDCTIYLDNHPLIPRVETEFWVERAIAEIKMSKVISPGLFVETVVMSDVQRPQRKYPERGQAKDQTSLQFPATHILDLCAGSGCVGVSVAKNTLDSLVDFGELSGRLITTIEKNCTENGIASERFNVYHSNLFQNIPTDNRYDFILSNPPYIDPAIDRATDSVKSHEPHLALYGGTDGLEVIEQLISTASDHLSNNGQLWIEHEPEQVPGIAKIAETYGFACVSHPDQYGVLRYSILVVQ